MDALTEKLEARLREWKPETAAQVRERIAEVIELTDHEALDLLRSRRRTGSPGPARLPAFRHFG